MKPASITLVDEASLSHQYLASVRSECRLLRDRANQYRQAAELLRSLAQRYRQRAAQIKSNCVS
jgi:hypothetical protein